MNGWIPWAALGSAMLAIAGGSMAQPWLMWLFKPLTTVLIIAYAWPRGDDTPAMQRWIRAGLVLSLGGDVALLWPQQGFLPGLVSFLLAHLSYIVAYTRDTRLAARPMAFVAYAVVAGGILSVLWPGVPAELHLPVLAYVTCLATMAAQAAARWWAGKDEPDAALRRWGAIGGLLFVCSDGLLAADRFQGPLPAASLLVLATYWAAQWCFASSLRRRASAPSPARPASISA